MEFKINIFTPELRWSTRLVLFLGGYLLCEEQYMNSRLDDGLLNFAEAHREYITLTCRNLRHSMLSN